LPIEDLDTPLAIATDGLSSNWSLNLWEEMRAALMLHHHDSLEKVAQRLIRAATLGGAKAIGSDAGRLEVGAPADIIGVTLPNHIEDYGHIALYSILHTHGIDVVYISGKKISP
jgi:cytosine/adenosine deaminase-related metal-dependent hydrolase